MNQITVEPILATRPEENAHNGLITLKVHIPQYVWVEFLTHRMFARNASSSRAQKSERHIQMGFYTPEIFYEDKTGMRVGPPVDDFKQNVANAIYAKAWEQAVTYVEQLTTLGITREQANRLLPTIKMMDGIMTTTERNWEYFIHIRNTPMSDVAMRIFVKRVDETINNLNWQISDLHIPMDDGSLDVKKAAAKIARVSYSGKSVLDDIELADRLIKDQHLSPFEHVAFYGYSYELEFIAKCVYNVNSEDWDNDCGKWYSYRSVLESQKDWHDLIGTRP